MSGTEGRHDGCLLRRLLFYFDTCFCHGGAANRSDRRLCASLRTEEEFEVKCVCVCFESQESLRLRFPSRVYRGAVFNYNSSCMLDTWGSTTNFHTSSHSCPIAHWVGGGGLQAHFNSNEVIGLVGLRAILIRADWRSATANHPTWRPTH